MCSHVLYISVMYSHWNAVWLPADFWLEEATLLTLTEEEIHVHCVRTSVPATLATLLEKSFPKGFFGCLPIGKPLCGPGSTWNQTGSPLVPERVLQKVGIAEE